MDDEVPRPEPPQPLPERVRAWVDWFGPLRLITSAIAVIVVCAGGWFLLRSPVPPPEASLPRASVASSVVSSDGDSAARADTRPAAATTVVSTSPEPTVVVVHVAGAVLRPGVYQFVAGSRVADAVERAGGSTAEGRPHLLNLAAPLVDGLRVRVPVDGEVVDGALALDLPTPNGADGGVSGPARPVDLNVASVAQLEELPGVGPATAAAIVAEREGNGPFVAVDDLERVSGIGPAKLAGLRDLVTT